MNSIKKLFIKMIIKWLLLTAILVFAASFVKEINFDSFWAPVLAAGAIALVNIFVKPILKIVTLPINMMSMGLFTIVLNALLLWGVSYYVPGFNIDFTLNGFLGACLGSIIISVLSVVLNFI